MSRRIDRGNGWVDEKKYVRVKKRKKKRSGLGSGGAEQGTRRRAGCRTGLMPPPATTAFIPVPGAGNVGVPSVLVEATGGIGDGDGDGDGGLG